MSLTHAASTRSGRGRFALCILGLGSLLIFLSLSAGVQSAVGTADEVHYTYTGPGSVAFDWRGTATDIRYGATTSYGSTATAHTPSPLPFSSAGPFQEVELTGLTPGATYHYSIGGGSDQTMATAPTSGFRFDVEADVGADHADEDARLVHHKEAMNLQVHYVLDHPRHRRFWTHRKDHRSHEFLDPGPAHRPEGVEQPGEEQGLGRGRRQDVGGHGTPPGVGRLRL